MQKESIKEQAHPIQEHVKQKQLTEQLHSVEGKIADAITDFSGSMAFVYFHGFWFTFWILANQGFLKPFILPFDPFPYGLLTMVVSLEAIFLSTFIMITQNRQALVDEYRELEEDIEQAEEDKEQEELEQDVEELGQDVQELGEDIDDIQKDMDQIQKDLANLVKGVTFIQQKLTNVEKIRQNNDKIKKSEKPKTLK